MAKEGYAVGGLVVDADQYVNAVRPVFMRLDKGKLNPDESYLGDWIGTPTGRPTRVLGNSGRKVLGIHGRQGLILDAIGLVME